jgi:lipopolysaccharide export system permease protein
MARLFTKFWLLERYLFGQMLAPLLAGLAGGTLLLLAGPALYSSRAAGRGIRAALGVLRLLILDLPEMVVLGMPIAAFFATLLTLGKLSGNSEITAMRAAGIPFTRIFDPYF